MLPLETSALSSALQELDVDQDVIDQVVSTLTATSDELGDGSFAQQAEIPPISFGDRSSAATLGLHHGKALAVIQATINAMATDLSDFAASTKTAATYVHDADGGSAAQLSKAQAAVEQMQDIANAPSNQTAYDDARNADPAPAGTAGGQG